MKKILVADNTEINESIITEVFSSEYDVITAKNSKETFRILTEQVSELAAALVCEKIAAGFSRDDLAMLQKLRVFRSVPLVLILSESGHSEKLVRAELDYCDVAASPVNPMVIRRRVDNLVRLYARTNGDESFFDDKDPLTGLWNFSGVRNRISEYLEGPGKDESSMMLLIDIDGFSSINRRTGYRFGNEILKDIGQVLRRQFSDKDIIGRVEDDNYVVFVKGCSVKDSGINIVDDLFRSLHKTYTFNGVTYPEITASIGVAEYPEHGTGFDEIFGCASKTVDIAKINGKNMYLFYNENMKTGWEMNEESAGTVDCSSDARDEDFNIYLMPIEDSATGRIITYELIESSSDNPDNYDFDSVYSAIYRGNNISAVSLNSIRRMFAAINRLEQQGVELPKLSLVTMFRGCDSEVIRKALEEILSHYPVNCKNICIRLTQDMLEDMETRSIAELVEFLKHRGFEIGVYNVGAGSINTKCFVAGLFDNVTFAGSFLENVTGGIIPVEIPVNLVQCFSSLGVSVYLPMHTNEEFVAMLRKNSLVSFGVYTGNITRLEDIGSEGSGEGKKTVPVLEHEQRELILSDKVYDEILEQTRSFIFEWIPRYDTAKFSGSFERMYGFVPPMTDFINNIRNVRLVHPDDNSLFIEKLNFARSGSAGSECFVRFYSMKDDEYRWNRVHVVAVRNSAGIPSKIMAVCADISEDRRRGEDESRRERTDYIAGLYKRSAAENKIRSYLKDEGAGGQHSLIIIEIRGYESMEAVLGRPFANAVCKETAANIRELFRDCDIIGRSSGSQFVIFVKQFADVDKLRGKAEKICEIIGNSYNSGEDSIRIAGNAGISLFPKDGRTYDELYSSALNALYYAKHQIHSSFAFSFESAGVLRLTAESTDKRGQI